MNSPSVLIIALPIPLYQRFEYLPEKDVDDKHYKIGTRVRVQFGARKLIGLIVDKAATSSIPANKLKHISESLDDEPVFDATLLALLFWAADYYQQPIGEVLFTALPAVLRKGKLITPATNTLYKLCSDQNLDTDLGRAPKQRLITELLRTQPQGLDADELSKHIPGWRSAMNALINKNFVEKIHQEQTPKTIPTNPATDELSLNTEQQQAYLTLSTKLDQFNCCL
ncbi:MAG: hypothetical protein AB8B92_04730, partial [Gammaproteobacteria bacterium]